MRDGEFDELAFFGAIHRSGARALLIGRRALVLLGLPVLTADYDFWIAIDDIAAFNGTVAHCETIGSMNGVFRATPLARLTEAPLSDAALATAAPQLTARAGVDTRTRRPRSSRIDTT